MPAQAQVLSALIINKIQSNMQGIDGTGPLGNLKDPSYYIEFCTAIGTGIAKGSPLIAFTTADTGSIGAPPVPGAGVGVGIMIDQNYFSQQIYTKCRDKILSQYGKTSHDPWIPGIGNSGQYLKAVSDGVAQAVMEHYQIAWILASINPIVYMGTAKVTRGNFSGLFPSLVQSLILVNGPRMQGSFWPIFAQMVAEAYVDTITNQSTATLAITGVCVPSLTQVCGIPATGTGTGTAT